MLLPLLVRHSSQLVRALALHLEENEFDPPLRRLLLICIGTVSKFLGAIDRFLVILQWRLINAN